MRTDGTMLRARPLIEWRAVFGGTILGLGFFALLNSLWLALAYGSELTVIRDQMPWFVAGSVVATLLIAGYLAGLLSASRGAGAGFINGSTVWALATIVGLSVGVPTVMRVFDIQGGLGDTANRLSSTAAWAGFVALVIGFLAAGIGGALGGAAVRAGTQREIVLDEVSERVTTEQPTTRMPAGPFTTSQSTTTQRRSAS